MTADSGSQLPIGCVFLSVKKDGYVTGYQSVRERAEGITIPLQPLRTVIGRVVAVEGPPVSDVKVLPGSTATFTDANGFFAKSGIGTYLSFGKPGYVDRFVLIPEGHDVDLGTIHIQPTIALSSGSRLMSRISSEDVDYDLAWWGDFGSCSPCKRIELQSGQRDLDIQLRWWGTIPLQLWAAVGSDGEMRSAKAAQGGSVLMLQVSATTSILFVGIHGTTGASQAFPEPEAFELTTLAQ